MSRRPRSVGASNEDAPSKKKKMAISSSSESEEESDSDKENGVKYKTIYFKSQFHSITQSTTVFFFFIGFRCIRRRIPYYSTKIWSHFKNAFEKFHVSFEFGN